MQKKCIMQIVQFIKRCNVINQVTTIKALYSTISCTKNSNRNQMKMPLSMERWKGKVAIVTGASSGIGAGIAKKLVEEGLQVAGLARRLNQIQALANQLKNESGKLYPIKCDVTQEKEILDAFEWIKTNLGPIHILINNAGVFLISSLHDGKTEDWKTIFDTNVLSLNIATREAIRDMRKNDVNGHIIHINSIYGHYIDRQPNHVYYASKHAVTTLTEVLRRELVTLNSKIKVTSISPGVVDTPLFEISGVGDILEDLKKLNPVLQVSDIVDGIIYVLSTPPHVQVHELIVRPVGETV